MRQYFVYVMGNRWGSLYIGVTNDLVRRVFEHKAGTFKGFTSKYKINLLLYFETTSSPRAAISREKKLKGWVRKKKLDLIKSANAGWDDLAANWYADSGRPKPGARSFHAPRHDPSPRASLGAQEGPRPIGAPTRLPHSVHDPS
jgi:putative endonuclease